MEQPQIAIQRWAGAQQPTETVLRQLFESEGLRPYRWANGPGDIYGAHAHAYHKVIYVVEGSITFSFRETGQKATLNPGDRLDLPPRVVHGATVGPRGVVCLEAHRAVH